MTGTAYRQWGLKFGPLNHVARVVAITATQLWDSGTAARTPHDKVKTITINPPSAGTIYIGTSTVTTADYLWAISSTSSAVVFDCDQEGVSNFWAIADAGGPRTVAIGQLG